MIVNQAQLVDIFGYNVITIKRWQKEGLPYTEREEIGGENQYDTAEVHKWIIDLKSEKSDYNTERTRLTKAQADKIERELALLEGHTMDTEEALAEWSKFLQYIKNKILALPVKLVAISEGVTDQNEMRSIFEKQVKEVLRDIANTEDYNTDSSENSIAPAGNDTLPVGG